MIADPVPLCAEMDLSPFAGLHARCFSPGWTAPALREMLQNQGVFAFSLGDGFIIARVASDEAEILTIAVSPETRMRGIGARLLERAGEHARSLGALAMFLEVAISNDAARALYNKSGFHAVGQRKAYYRNADGLLEDGLILRAELPLAPLGNSAASIRVGG